MAKPGAILWHDLTVDEADSIRDFYASVIGWTHSPIAMDGYSDYVMQAGEDGVSGVCHRRGPNASIPPQWIMYVGVADLDDSIAKATSLGGQVLHGPRNMGAARFCIVKDPAGAVIGLYEEKETDKAAE
jgi:predicted enzyme related to lactoylglutathione lyase